MIQSKTISELIHIREKARENKNYNLCDEIRDYLDTKQCFIFDTKDGQLVYHYPKGMTRDKLIKNINRDKRGEKLFDAWLYSIKQSKNKKI